MYLDNKRLLDLSEIRTAECQKHNTEISATIEENKKILKGTAEMNIENSGGRRKLK